MNWLAHLLLSEPNVENRLGNLLGDLAKGKEIERLNDSLKLGIYRHYAIDNFTDHHETIIISKRRMGKDYSRFSGVLIDVFYDHFLAKHWSSYTKFIFSDFIAEIHQSFLSYSGEIPAEAQRIIRYMIREDWLSSYLSLAGVESALKRIEYRIERRTDRQINLTDSMQILRQEYLNLEQDFCSFFPELQKHIEGYNFVAL
jgi:acyl carrier protein phosphodiesterase